MNQKTLGVFSLFFLISLASASESTLKYALKQGLAQGSLLLKARKVEALLRDPLVPERTKESLRLSQEVIAFAKKIPMKVGSSYLKFVELEHDWVTQVVIAAYKDRLELKDFNFPLVGSFPYKGYFDEEDAIREETELAKNYDSFRRKVPAFSSLGWFADPLTSNLLRNDYSLVETLFHELLHLNFYFEDNSDFNEAFATWFSYKATQDFIDVAKHIGDREEFKLQLKESLAFDGEINAFIEEVNNTGRGFYALENAEQRREKYFNWVAACVKKYPALKYLDKIQWNNAAILSFSTYTRLIPMIEDYAQAHKLNYKELLLRVMSKGPSIVLEIEKSKAIVATSRCGSVSP